MYEYYERYEECNIFVGYLFLVLLFPTFRNVSVTTCFSLQCQCNSMRSYGYIRAKFQVFSAMNTYIALTINILHIIHPRAFILKHNVTETKFCLRPWMLPTQLSPIDRTTPCLRFGDSRYHLKTETESSL
jgi:hypothetical protein